MLASSNTLPDLALLDGFWISRLVETGTLQPLNDLWSADSRAHWLPASVDAVTLDGNIYAVPFHTSWRDFRRWLRPILMLAVVLVAVTILSVGLVAKWMLPDLPWAVCFVLGAIVSPTDTVAA